MRNKVPAFPPIPVYDPAKDGNPFVWIVDQAPKVRAERDSDAQTQRLMRRMAWRAANSPVGS